MSGNAKFQKQFVMFVALVCAVLFAPTTLIFIVCMMPSIAVNLVDKTRQKSRALCVSMLNFAGTLAFLLELWMSPAPNAIDNAMAIVLQTKTVVITYSIAAAGYAIEAAVTGMVAAMLQQKAAARLKVIEKQLAELVDRWNTYVDGSRKLDDYGFPIEMDE